MSATISDYFNKASNMNGDYPTVATVSSARSAGATTLTCDDLSGWATSTPVHFSTFQVDASGTIDPTTQTDWKGIVSGNTITNLTRLAGAADSGNTSGDRVELNPTIGWLDDLITGILVSHNQDGTLKNASVQTQNVDWPTITRFCRFTGGNNTTFTTGTMYMLPNQSNGFIHAFLCWCLTGGSNTGNLFLVEWTKNDYANATITNLNGNSAVTLALSSPTYIGDDGVQFVLTFSKTVYGGLSIISLG